MNSNQTTIVTYTERFVQALSALCHAAPPLDICRAWLHCEDEALQSWVGEHQHCTWATAIGTIDAARLLADSTVEEEPQLVSLRVEVVLQHLAQAPIQVFRRGASRWLASALPVGLSQADISEAAASEVAEVEQKNFSTGTLVASARFCLAPASTDQTHSSLP